MIIEDIEDTNVTVTMSCVQAGVLLKFLSLPLLTPLQVALVSESMEKIGVVVGHRNVVSHLEAIRVVLDDYEEDIFPHLGMGLGPDEPIIELKNSGLVH